MALVRATFLDDLIVKAQAEKYDWRNISVQKDLRSALFGATYFPKRRSEFGEKDALTLEVHFGWFFKKSNLGHNGKRAIILIELRGGFQNLTFRKYSKQVNAKGGLFFLREIRLPPRSQGG